MNEKVKDEADLLLDKELVEIKGGYSSACGRTESQSPDQNPIDLSLSSSLDSCSSCNKTNSCQTAT